jgi:hypothetical protein
MKPTASPDRFRAVTIDDATTAKDGRIVMLNHWWATDGENIFFFRQGDAPQCNTNKELAQKIAAGRGQDVVFLPIAFLEHNCGDHL